MGYFRLDMEFALINGTSTKFYINEMTQNAIVNRLPIDSKQGELDIQIIDGELNGVVIDTISFCKFLNSTSYTQLDPSEYRGAIASLCYRLIHIRPLNGRSIPSQLDNLCHLALLAYMTVLLPEFNKTWAWFDLISKQLGEAKRNTSDTEITTSSLYLCCLFVGGISVFDEGDDWWLKQFVANSCQHLGRLQWEDICAVLGELFWIHIIHDKHGKLLWNRIQS